MYLYSHQVTPLVLLLSWLKPSLVPAVKAVASKHISLILILFPVFFLQSNQSGLLETEVSSSPSSTQNPLTARSSLSKVTVLTEAHKLSVLTPHLWPSLSYSPRLLSSICQCLCASCWAQEACSCFRLLHLLLSQSEMLFFQILSWPAFNLFNVSIQKSFLW